MMKEAVLKVHELCVSYDTQGGSTIKAVDGVSFEVWPDEVFGLVGESGSGKSTLCLAVLRLISPPGKILGGQVIFNGVDLLAMDDRALRRVRWKEISYIPQGAMSCLNPVMRIQNHLYDTIESHEGPQPQESVNARIDRALAGVRLEPNVLKKFPHELSGGMRQRVCIALAMMLYPRLIIADEPTSALDVVSQRIVLETLSEMRQSLHASMILVGHDMALQAQVADRLGIMYSGRLIEVGSVTDIFNNPIHPYTQCLISSVPSIQRKSDIHELAMMGLTEVERCRLKIAAPLVEVSPGHYVAQHN